MKTALFAPLYLDGVDTRGNNRLERNIKYLNYYWPLREKLGFDKIVMADNGSHVRNILALLGAAPTRVWLEPFNPFSEPMLLHENEGIHIHCFEDHLAFGSSKFPDGDPRRSVDYPYCWRAFQVIERLFLRDGYTKVIAIDTDGFVLSERLATAIRVLNSGWATVWCKRYGFPEAALQIIEREAFLRLRAHIYPYMDQVGKKMEEVLPFTNVYKFFNCDRFGETRDPVTSEIDFYGQAPNDMEMKFRRSERNEMHHPSSNG